VANSGTDSVSVLLGLGNGTFRSAVNYGVVGDQPKSVVLADFNGDGRLDLLTANQGDAGTVSILYNNPNSVGTFQPAVVVAGVPGSHEVVSADVDLDGDLDIAVAGWGGSTIRVLLNSGSGVFSSSNSFIYNVGNAPHSLQFGDFNKDARPDLAVANTNSNSVTILLNGVAGAAAGTFTATSTYSVGGGPHSIRLADVDGDGNLDLATANQNSDSISLLLGEGDGTFTPTTELGTGPVPKGIAIADVNGDGLLDLLTANTAGNYPDNSNNPGGDSISILYGEGQGAFSAPVTVTTGNTPFAVIAADFNADGLLDLATANWFGSAGSGSAGVLINGTQPPANDGTGPAATLTAGNITVAPGGAYTFTVRYADPSGVDVATIDNTDIRVTGPNGYVQFATRISTTPASNSTSVTATYSIPAPGGGWDIGDNGNYAVNLQPGTVRDSFGNGTAAAALGSFTVNIANTTSTVYLSDLTPTASTNGWGPYERDRSNGEQGATDGRALTINGTTYAKGLGVHAASTLTYSLGGLYSRFQSFIGVDDEVPSNTASVIFRVLADGEQIFQSATLTGASAPQLVDLDVAGVQSLQLIVDNADGSSDYDHANWADAKLIRGEVFRLSSNELNIISEADGEAVLLAERVSANLRAATLQFTTNEIVGSATPGVDFTPPSTAGFNTGQITFADGDATQPISVLVVDDNEVELNELFAVGIQNPSTGSLGAPRTARILIVDDDGAARISLVQTNVTVSEGDGTATLTLVRSGDRSSAATVQVVTADGTATAGIDYGSVSTTVSFEAGSFVQTVEIPILYDFELESSESFQVQISDPVGASLQGNTEATVTIQDQGNLQRQSFVSGLNRPTTFDWLPDGSTMLVAEKGGVVQVVVNGAVRSTPLIDLSSIVNDTGDRGLLGLAVHPDFGGANPYVYVAYTYDPPETAGQTGNAGQNGNGNRPARLEKLTVDPATLAVTGREVILGRNSLWRYTSRPDIDSTGTTGVLPSGIVNGTTITADNAPIDQGYQDNIPNLEGVQNLNIRDYLAGDSTSHTIGDVEFGPDGYLYVTVGDGTSYNFQDDRAVRVQDIGNLSGKTLRLDPLTGLGVETNPFFNGDPDSNQSKVFYSGLRNPYRFSFDPVSGLPMVGDVGWNTWEEINTGAPGTNFGWPYFEGPDQTGGYSSLASAQVFYNNGNINPGSPDDQPAVAPLRTLSHSDPDNFAAIMVGDFISTNTFVYGELLSGRLFSATLDGNRELSSLTEFDTGASYMVDVKLGPDGTLYGSSLYNSQFGPGEIVRWLPA
jgi:glucose/arabinose dehydrogenase